MRRRSSHRHLALLLGLALFAVATIASAIWVTRASTISTLRDDARQLAVHWAHHIDARLAGGTAGEPAPDPDPRRFRVGRYAGFVSDYVMFDKDGTVLAGSPGYTAPDIAALQATQAFAADRDRALASGNATVRYNDTISPWSNLNVASVMVPLDAGSGARRLVYVEADQSAAFTIIRRAVRAVIIFLTTVLALAVGGLLIYIYRRLGDHWELQEHVQFLSGNDTMTGLPNRALFTDMVAEALGAARRSGEKTAVLCLDIDRFRETNDALGHPAGDSILRHVSAMIRETILQHHASAARLGGDEFGILVRGPAAQEHALVLARALRDRLRTPHGTGQSEHPATISLGLAVGPVDGDDALTLIKHADIALNQARANGPDASRFYTPSMERAAQRRKTMEHALRRAMENDELFLHYQPQFDLLTGKVTGYEALLRWNHPEEGVVSPADFIASAEETGLILEMGEWAMRTGCRYAAQWPGTTRIAINLSAMQIMHDDIYDTIAAILGETGLPPERLEIEITESLLLRNVERVQATLRKLADLGVSLAVDDFGTGYSSLSYLASFRFSKIKIDQCFIAAIGAGRESTAVIRAIVGLGNALEIEITAEGVETAEQLAALHRTGCRNVQGFLCGRPQPEILGDWDVTVTAAKLARPERAAEIEQAAAAEPLPVAQRSA